MITALRRRASFIFLLIIVAVSAFSVGRLQAQSCELGLDCFGEEPSSCMGLHVHQQTDCAMYAYFDPSCWSEYCCQGVLTCCAPEGACGFAQLSYCQSSGACGSGQGECPCTMAQ